MGNPLGQGGGTVTDCGHISTKIKLSRSPSASSLHECSRGLALRIQRPYIYKVGAWPYRRKMTVLPCRQPGVGECCELMERPTGNGLGIAPAPIHRPVPAAAVDVSGCGSLRYDEYPPAQTSRGVQPTSSLSI
jgi:hypothetical protein